MPNLKDLKNRIESVKSTRKITKAMQMVAAAKLRKAQEAAEQARPYADKMSLVMDKITSSDNVSSSSPSLTGNGNNNIHLIIIATSERGLCGAFNSSIVRLAKNHINKLKSEGFQFKILTIGKKGREQLKREFGENMIDHVDLSEVKKIAYENASTISDNIISMFLNNEFDVAKGNGTIFLGKEGFENDHFFSGAIDDVRIYNTCAGYQYVRKAPAQVTENYGLNQQNSAGPYEDLEGFLNNADELALSLLEMGINGMKICS